MSATPRKYRFDKPMPPVEPRPLPARRPQEAPAEPFGPYPLSYDHGQQPVQQVIHVHHAQPDRVLQRLALGAGVGGGMAAAGVYFGPLLIAGMWSIAITFGVGGLVLVVIVRSLVSLLNPPQQPAGKGKRRR